MRHAPPPPREAGFTLAELLLASALGALLLASLAVTTYSFTETLTHLEDKAGFNDDVDPVVGRVTRDIREAWRAEPVSSTHLRLVDPSGEVTEYYEVDGSLFIKRPNGESGALLEDLTHLGFDFGTITRCREGSPVAFNGLWYAAPVSGSVPDALVVEGVDKVSLGFTVPAVDSGLIGGAGSEQVLDAAATALSVPLAWDGAPSENLVIELYESGGPGSATPIGSALASLSMPAGPLPLAEHVDPADEDSDYVAPSGSVAISLAGLSASLEAGVGYCLVMSSSGSATMVLKAHPGVASGSDDVAQQFAGGAWVEQASGVPFSLTGSCNVTSTLSFDEVNSVSLTIEPNGRPAMMRSASLLSQAISDDPWLGVVPGETPP